jgi:hypothetical protein
VSLPRPEAGAIGGPATWCRPSEPTLRRVLVGVDGDALDRALGAFMAAQVTDPDSGLADRAVYVYGFSRVSVMKTGRSVLRSDAARAIALRANQKCKQRAPEAHPKLLGSEAREAASAWSLVDGADGRRRPKRAPWGPRVPAGQDARPGRPGPPSPPARPTPFLGERYRRIARRRGEQRAVVAVGRSILTIVWQFLSPGSTHRPRPDYDDNRIDPVSIRQNGLGAAG